MSLHLVDSAPARQESGHDVVARGGDALSRLQTLLARDMAATETVIRSGLASRSETIGKVAGHIVDGGGKRLRPLLALASARLCAAEDAPPRAAPLAAAVELIHTATLLHDDVVDASRMRRGQITANRSWGDKASILVGDFLFSRAFQLVVDFGTPDILRAMARAATIMSEGEVLQLQAARRVDIAPSLCLRIIAAKTARLFALACRIGALASGATQRRAAVLERFGLDFGMAFQLTDDLLDYLSPHGVVGKEKGDDFREGKVTLPVIFAYGNGLESERRFWRDCFTGGETARRKLQFARARALIRESGAAHKTMAWAQRFGGRAQKALGDFAPCRLRRSLLETVAFCIGRAG